MALREFPCVVLGDEPAGFWLLSELARYQSARSLHLRLGSPTRFVLPGIVSAQLPGAGASFHSEIRTPKISFPWSPPSLAARFPALPPPVSPKQGAWKLTSSERSAIRYALREHPELLSYATALWKYFGRSLTLSAENLIASALLCTELYRWESPTQTQWETRDLFLDEQTIEKVESTSGGKLQVQLRQSEPFITSALVLNCSITQLFRLCVKDKSLLRWLSLDGSLLAPFGTCPLPVKVSASCLGTVPQMTFYLQNSDIPEPLGELWPFECRSTQDGDQQLNLLVSVERELSLDRTLDRFRNGLQRLHSLFPFLSSGVRELGYSLEMESCAAPSDRACAATRLELSFRENYSLTSFEVRCRNPRLFVLMPFLNCHLPYPLGTLYAAQGLVTTLVGKSLKN